MTEATIQSFTPKRLENKDKFGFVKEGLLSPEEMELARKFEGLASLMGITRLSEGPGNDDRNETTRVGLQIDSKPYLLNITSIWSLSNNSLMARSNINLYELPSGKFDLKEVEKTLPVLSMEKRTRELKKELRYAVFYRNEAIGDKINLSDYKKAIENLMTAIPDQGITFHAWVKAVDMAGIQKFDPFIEFERSNVRVKIAPANKLNAPRARF